MNSKLLLALAMFVTTTTFAQTNQLNVKRQLTKIKNVNEVRIAPSIEHSSASIELGTELYVNDFSDSTTFTKTSTSGYWVFGTNATIGSGNYFSAPFASPTAANGYAMIDSDGFGDGQTQDASITTGPIDLTAATGQIGIVFQQYYARFYDVASIEVSTDNINFTVVGDNSDIPQVVQGGTGTPTTNPSQKIININQYAGQTIYVRFHFVGAWDYTWLVDDLSINELIIPEFDLAANGIENCNIFTHYSFDQIPLTQVDSLGFTVYVENLGTSDQNYTLNYDIKLAGTSVSTGSTPSLSLTSFSLDTVSFNTPFMPSAVGSYTIEVTMASSNTDFNPADNVISNAITLSDYIYSPINTFATTDYQTFSGTATAAPYNIAKIGQSFPIYSNQDLKQVQFSLSRQAGFSGPQDFIVEIYEYIPATGRPDAVPIFIGDYTMETTHSNTSWQSVNIPGGLSLEEGKTYVVSIGYEDTDKKWYFNTVPDGDADAGTWGYGPFGVGSAVNWYIGWDFSPAIRMNFDPNVGIESTSDVSNLVVFPNPANQTLNVNFNLNTPSNVSVNLIDITGKVVFSKSVSGKIMKYQDTLSLSQFANGVYTLQIATNNGISTEKIVIAH